MDVFFVGLISLLMIGGAAQIGLILSAPGTLVHKASGATLALLMAAIVVLLLLMLLPVFTNPASPLSSSNAGRGGLVRNLLLLAVAVLAGIGFRANTTSRRRT